MLVSEIIQSSIPVLHYEDTVEEAIDLLQQNNIGHLAVIHNDNYQGLLSIDELLAAEDSDILSMLTEKFIHVSIQYDQHFLSALKLIAESAVTALPVLSQNKEYLGVVTESILVQTLKQFSWY
jgi:CBS domain-containing protein